MSHERGDWIGWILTEEVRVLGLNETFSSERRSWRKLRPPVVASSWPFSRWIGEIQQVIR
jgi:hypothetical protein